MSVRHRPVSFLLTLLLSSAAAGTAAAQPYGGSEGTGTPPPSDRPGPTIQGDDHGLVIGELGMGWFGLQPIPAVGVNAATVGIRYWIGETLGVDAALGFGFRSDSTEVPGLPSMDSSAFGLLFHGGLPLVMTHGGHYKFLIVPEAEIGFGNAEDAAMTESSGLTFRAGTRVGAEVHLGMIDVPQISLQASVGAFLEFTSLTTTDAGGNETKTSNFSVTTVELDEPWSVFVANIAAVYYLI